MINTCGCMYYLPFVADIFYSKLQKYLLSEEQLVDNGYPRLTNDKGVVLIKRENTVEPVPVESMGSNGQPYVHVHEGCMMGSGAREWGWGMRPGSGAGEWGWGMGLGRSL